MDFSTLLASADRVALSIMGSPIRYRRQFGEEIEIRGIFDAQYRRPDASQPGVAQIGPAVFVLLSDLKTAAGEAIDPTSDFPLITIGGVEYRLREPQVDGQGGVLLHLVKV